jgi:hypothetical protein
MCTIVELTSKEYMIKTYFISVHLLVGYISVNIPQCMDMEHIKTQMNKFELKVTCFIKTNDTNIHSVQLKYVQMANGGNLW